MFTYAMLYLLFYYQILFIIFAFFLLYSNFSSLQTFSLSRLLFFIKNYTSHYNQFFLLPLILSGLPPVGFFIIKLSYLIKIFSSISLTIQLLLFINFLLTMFFYLQYFNITVTTSFDTTLLLQTKNENFSILRNQKMEISTLTFKFWVFYVGIITLNILTLFIYFDLYMVFFFRL